MDDWRTAPPADGSSYDPDVDYDAMLIPGFATGAIAGIRRQAGSPHRVHAPGAGGSGVVVGDAEGGEQPGESDPLLA